MTSWPEKVKAALACFVRLPTMQKPGDRLPCRCRVTFCPTRILQNGSKTGSEFRKKWQKKYKVSIYQYGLLFTTLFGASSLIGWCRLVIEQRSLLCHRQLAVCLLSGSFGVLCAIGARSLYYSNSDPSSLEEAVLWMLFAAIVGGFCQKELSRMLQMSAETIVRRVLALAGFTLDDEDKP